MKEKDNKYNNGSAGFLRYLKGVMSDREKNTFERELQKDPFAAEAMEGLSEISPESAGNDISQLESQVQRKASRRERFVIYRIAASVAVLMIISSVFIIVQRQRSQKEPGEIPSAPAPLEISQPSAILKQQTEETRETKSAYAVQGEKKDETNLIAGSAGTEPAKKEEPVSGRIAQPAVERAKEDDQIAQVQEFKAALSAPETGKMEADMQPDETNLSEVVVVSYGVKRDEKAANMETDYTPPLPSDGRNNFDKYIEDNIRLPQSLKEGDKAVVVISFTVTKAGATDSLKIVRSPGQEFSDEAKRLILEGPSWKPAVSFGEAIDGDVRVRIVFKK